MEKTVTTQNGVDIHYYLNEGLHGFCLSLYAHAGPMYEGEKESGVSHFVEHIIFRNINLAMKGSLYETLDRLGLTFTAATYKEFIQLTITGASRNFCEAVKILMMAHLPLSKDLLKREFELERGRIKAEIREYDENTSLEYAVKKKVLGNTPVSRMITGTTGSVSKISLCACERARGQILSSENFFFYVTGKVPNEGISFLKQTVESTLFPAPCVSRNNISARPESFGSRELEIIKKDSSYYMVELSFDVDTAKSTKPVRNLLYDILFSGENSLFFRELSENLGFIYSYDAKLEEYRNVGVLSVSYEVSLANLYSSIEKAVEIFNSLKKQAGNLSTARVYYTDNACLALDNAEELNWNMAYENYILGDGKSPTLSVEDKREAYLAVTEKDIRDLAKQTFLPCRLVAGIKGKKKKIDENRVISLLMSLNV